MRYLCHGLTNRTYIVVLPGSVDGQFLKPRVFTGNFSSAYSSSKWALEGLSRSIAYALADWGIRCNVIQPGFIETDMTAAMLNNPLAKRLSHRNFNNIILLRCAGKAEAIGYTDS